MALVSAEKGALVANPTLTLQTDQLRAFVMLLTFAKGSNLLDLFFRLKLFLLLSKAG